MSAVKTSSTVSPLGQLSGRRRFSNMGMTLVVYLAFLLALIPLIWLSVTVVERGVDRFFVDANGDANFNLDFLNQSMRNIFGGMPEGGIVHAIWGTVLMTLAATVISVPIGLLTAIYLV